MLKHYIKIAIRNIRKFREFSLINITGLSIGLACLMLSFLWITHERNYEIFFSDLNNIYLVSTWNGNDTKDKGSYYSPYALSKSIVEKYPEAITFTRFENYAHYSSCMFKCESNGDKIFYEDGFYLADSTFFSIFDFTFKHGNIANAFSKFNNIVISEKTAVKYFGAENPIGKTLIFNNSTEFVVSGVVSIPTNTELSFDLLAINTTVREPNYLNGWDSNGSGFVKLSSSVNVKELNKKLNKYVHLHESPLVESTVVGLYPLTKLHTRYGINFIIYIIISITVLILVIAVLNYISLSTALFSKRAKQVALNKISGALKISLSAQFIVESILTVWLAMLFAFGLSSIILPLFNKITASHLVLFNNTICQHTILYFFLIATATGFVAGIIPSILLALKNPLKLLNAKSDMGHGINGRKPMVVIQFVISIFLICSTLFIYKQRAFIDNQPLGFNETYILKLQLNDTFLNKYDALVNRLKQNSNVLHVTAASSIPAGIGNHSPLRWGASEEDYERNTKFAIVSPGYISTFNMELSQGNSFDFSSSSENGYIINEEMAKRMDDPNPVGRTVIFWGRNGTVIGVVKDFQNNWRAREIKPMVLSAHPESKDFMKFLFIKINSTNISSTINYVASVSNEIAPNYPFDYTFTDKEIEAYLNDQARFNSIFLFFAVVAILLACMGLFGLSLFSAEKRTKEIGVRKVNGAKVVEIFNLLNRELISCIVISFIIAVPLINFLLKQWLQNFSYKTSLSWWVFVLSGIIVLLIALLTVSWQTFRAARKNPVEALRYE